MGFRIRKSFGTKGFRVNISKSGIGYSVGTKGARITKTASGRTRTTASIPGTGISYTSESGGKRKATQEKAANNQQQANNSGCLKTLLSIVFFPITLLVAIIKGIVKSRK